MNNKLLLTLVLGILTLGARADKATNHQQVSSDFKQHNIDKIGYVDADYVSGSLPAAKKIAVELQSYEKQLQNQLEAEMGKLKELYETYQKEHKGLSEIEQSQKMAEIDKLRTKIQQLEQDSTQLAAEKRFELTKPIFDQINKVIKELAEEKGFSFIFNKNLGGAPVIFYGKEAFDITMLVLERLKKITEPVKAPVAIKKKKVAKNVAPSTKKGVKK